MTTVFSSLFSDQLSSAIGWTLLHSLWQGLCIAVPVWVLLRQAVRLSARVRYVVSMLALLLIFGAACLTFGVLYSSESAVGTVAATNDCLQPPQTGSMPVAQAQTASTDAFGAVWLQTAEDFRSYFEHYLPWVVMGWFIGMLVLTIRLAGGLWYIRQLRHRHQSVLATEWQQVMDKLCHRIGMKRAVQVIESVQVQVPAAIGYFKPLILVPVGAFTGLSAQQVEAVLAHELAHIVRNDYWFNIFQSLMENLFFFHPIVWWLSATARQEREHCCDDMAVQLSGSTLAYAQALTTLEVNQQLPRLSMAIHGHQGVLLRRIQRLLQHPAPKPARTEGGLIAGLLLITLMTFSTQAFSGVQKTFQTAAVAPPETITYYATFTDTNKVVREIVIVKDKKGNIQQVTIDGKKLSKEEMKKYREVIVAKLKRAEEEEDMLVPAPPIAPMPPEIDLPLAPLAEVDVQADIDMAPEVPPIPPACPPVPPVPPVPATPSSEMMDIEEKMAQLNEQIQELAEKHPYNHKRLGTLHEKLDQLASQYTTAADKWHQDFHREYAREMKQYQQEMRHFQNEMQQYQQEMRVFEQEERKQAAADRIHEQQERIEEAEEREEARMERMQQEQEERVIRHKREADKIRATRESNESFADKLIAKLSRDGWIKDSKNYTIRLRRTSLQVDGKELPPDVFQTYKKWMKEVGQNLDQWKDTQRMDVSHSED